LQKYGTLAHNDCRILTPPQAVISFFFKEYKWKAKPKVAKGTKRKRGQALAHLKPEVELEPELEPKPKPEPEPEPEPLADRIDPEEEALAKALEGNAAKMLVNKTSELAVQTAHDATVAKRLKEQATVFMEKKGVVISPSETNTALKVFPKVCCCCPDIV
jgi:hypothetical protein